MDAALVVRAQGGDRRAFEVIIDAVGGHLESVASVILRDPELAKDATQQALVAVWQNLPKLRDPARFDAWAYRILVHACRSEHRGTARWLPNILSLEDRLPDAVDEAGRVEDRDEMARAFRRLTLDQRAVVVLHHYADLPRDQVAEVLGIPVGTVHSRLRQAMRVLRAAIEADARPSTTESRPAEVAR